MTAATAPHALQIETGWSVTAKVGDLVLVPGRGASTKVAAIDEVTDRQIVVGGNRYHRSAATDSPAKIEFNEGSRVGDIGGQQFGKLFPATDHNLAVIANWSAR